MPVFVTARYQVRPESLRLCVQAIRDLVAAIAKHEQGTLDYTVWQETSDPTRFLHRIVFADAAARAAHANSDAVRRFTGIIYSNAASPVEFTDHVPLVSTGDPDLTGRRPPRHDDKANLSQGPGRSSSRS